MSIQRIKMFWLFVMMLYIFVVGSPARANNHALIIGINDYSDRCFPPLKGAENDALMMRHVLLTHGFSTSNITVLRNRNATLASVERILKTLASNSKHDDTILFYFSGHGTRIADVFDTAKRGVTSGHKAELNQQALALYDSIIRDPRTFLVEDEIKHWMQMAKAKHKVILMDACRASSNEISSDKDGVMVVTPRSNAAYELNISLANSRHFSMGIFTAYLCKQLMVNPNMTYKSLGESSSSVRFSLGGKVLIKVSGPGDSQFIPFFEKASKSASPSTQIHLQGISITQSEFISAVDNQLNNMIIKEVSGTER